MSPEDGGSIGAGPHVAGHRPLKPRSFTLCRKTKGAPNGAPLASEAMISLGRARRQRSERIVHFELDRMRCHFEPLDFGHLQLDVAVDEVVVEHPAVLE